MEDLSSVRTIPAGQWFPRLRRERGLAVSLRWIRRRSLEKDQCQANDLRKRTLFFSFLFFSLKSSRHHCSDSIQVDDSEAMTHRFSLSDVVVVRNPIAQIRKTKQE